MSTPRAWRGAPRRLILSFTLVLLAPAAAVVWLGVRLVDEDRALASRQLRERRESAADRLVAGLAQALSASERRLVGGSAALAFRPGDDAVMLTLGRDAVGAAPADRLLYRPALPALSSEPIVEFDAGESLEFRTQDYRAAGASYRALIASPSTAVRAGALLRLGRTMRKMDRPDEALAAYADLARLRDVAVSGLPADLVARRARCALLEETGRLPELRSEARALHADLMAAHWPLDRGTFLAYSEQTRRWGGADLPGDPAREALSAAAEWIWQQWTEAPVTNSRPPGGARAGLAQLASLSSGSRSAIGSPFWPPVRRSSSANGSMQCDRVSVRRACSFHWPTTRGRGSARRRRRTRR